MKTLFEQYSLLVNKSHKQTHINCVKFKGEGKGRSKCFLTPYTQKLKLRNRCLPNRDDVREEDDVANEVDEPEAAESLQGQQNNREKDRREKEDLGQTVDLQVNKTYLGAWVNGGRVLGHVIYTTTLHFLKDD